MTPTTREEFKEYCLRALGHPVIQINVSEEQVDDRVDEALRFYTDYHFDASEKTYLKQTLTQTDIDNGYLTLPENIFGAVSVFNPGGSTSIASSLFDVRYQIALNDLYSMTSVSLVPFYLTMQKLQLMEQILIGQPLIRYTRHRNRLHIDIAKDKLRVGDILVVEAYEIIDPDQFQDVWKDRWLYKYCTQLIKRQWGNNTKKFGNMQLPGGITFSGQQTYTEAENEINKMEEEMVLNFSLPVLDFIG
jgi:hypothetical protein